ncbi:MAG: hypothetical protein ACKV2T_42335 [Kofleriaceae bacterium]
MRTDEVWHIVEARRDDGKSALFRIRDLERVPGQERIFVVELPYPLTQLSRLPDAATYRRLSAFEEQWVRPACAQLAWTFVATKTEDGSSFFYLYGAGDLEPMVEKLSPFDGALAFFDEWDASWDEYAALRELLAEANAMKAKTTTAKRPAAKKPAAKKPAAKKPAAKKPAAKKPAAKKPAAKKPAAKKPAAKKPAAKRPPKKRPT